MFSEDEMRRPTPIRSTLRVCNCSTGSNGPERRIGPLWMVARTNRRCDSRIGSRRQLLAAALTGGRVAVRELGEWLVGWQWYLVVILGPAAFSLAVAGVYVLLLGGSWSAAVPSTLGEAPLVMLPVLLLILALIDGLGEEPAWLRAPAAACPEQRPGDQPDPWGALGAVAPPPALDRGGHQIP